MPCDFWCYLASPGLFWPSTSFGHELATSCRGSFVAGGSRPFSRAGSTGTSQSQAAADHHTCARNVQRVLALSPPAQGHCSCQRSTWQLPQATGSAPASLQNQWVGWIQQKRTGSKMLGGKVMMAEHLLEGQSTAHSSWHEMPRGSICLWLLWIDPLHLGNSFNISYFEKKLCNTQDVYCKIIANFFLTLYKPKS